MPSDGSGKGSETGVVEMSALANAEATAGVGAVAVAHSKGIVGLCVEIVTEVGSVAVLTDRGVSVGVLAPRWPDI